MYRQAENVMLLEMDISPPTMFMLNLNGPHLDRAYTPRLIPDLLANIPLRERSGSSSRVRKSQSWWVSERVSEWPTGLHPLNSRVHSTSEHWTLFWSCSLLLNACYYGPLPRYQAPLASPMASSSSSTALTSESQSRSPSQRPRPSSAAYLPLDSSPGSSPWHLSFNTPAHRAGPQFSLAQR